jgi:ribose 5-phosphate isomerase B
MGQNSPLEPQHSSTTFDNSSRAGLIHDVFSAHQGVEDDNMNVFCLGGKVIGSALAWELLKTFLAARFTGAPRHMRRVAKIQSLENPSVLA